MNFAESIDAIFFEPLHAFAANADCDDDICPTINGMKTVDLTNSDPTTNELRKSYDEIPYPNVAKPFTHISRMAALGRLRGVTPASPGNCQVLELGCADGGNLLPMALQFHESRFVGIDLSPVQIDMGRKVTADLSVSNLELRTADILELGDGDLDRYDYIIVHGVYSWVSSEVQEKTLSICRDHLTENGLAYVSYNSYPGWHGKQALRKMLRYHTRRIDDPREKVKAALALLVAFPTSVDLPNDPAAILVQRLRHDLENIDDPVTYLVHEYLVDANEPLYFREFLDRAEAFGLRYVDDAFPGSTAIDRLPPASRKFVSETFTDYSEQQQYVDYLCNVSFRRSLLCHSCLPLEHDVTFDRVQPLYLAATCNREDSEAGEPQFRSDPGRGFSVEHPGLRSALECLIDARPASISFTQLRHVMGDGIADDEAAAIFDGLLRTAAVEFTSHPFCCTLDMGERPYASRLVRYQSTDGTVTSAAHRPVGLDDALERHLVELLDGTHTVHELISSLRSRLTPDKAISDAQWDTLVRGRLSWLAKAGLLRNPESEPGPN
jgi:hypothetical protein